MPTTAADDSLTAVKICNLALMKLGMSPITSFSEENNVAKMCAAYFPVLRDRMLRDHFWSFAVAHATLVATTTASFDPEYRYACSMPSDLIRIIEIVGNMPYRIAGQYILTNAAGGTLVYIRRVEDTRMFDENFCEALQYLLAAEIGMTNTRDANLVNSFRQAYAERLAIARSIDSQENRFGSQFAKPYSTRLAARNGVFCRHAGGISEWTEGTEGVQK